jgi:hypothetical protein
LFRDGLLDVHRRRPPSQVAGSISEAR